MSAGLNQRRKRFPRCIGSVGLPRRALDLRTRSMAIREKSDAGLPLVATEPDSPRAQIYRDIAAKVADQLKAGGGRAAPKIVIEA